MSRLGHCDGCGATVEDTAEPEGWMHFSRTRDGEYQTADACPDCVPEDVLDLLETGDEPEYPAADAMGDGFETASELAEREEEA